MYLWAVGVAATGVVMTEMIPHLTIEILGSGLIRLENESMGDCYAVDLHPIQLRHLAEKMGLIKKGSVDKDRLLARLKREMLMIRDRCEQLHQNIYGLSQLGHEDMGIEVAQSAALADITDLICADFENEVDSIPAQAILKGIEDRPAPTKTSVKSAPGAELSRSAPGADAPAQMELTA